MAEKRSGTHRQRTRAAEKRSEGHKTPASRAEKRSPGPKETTRRTEKRSDGRKAPASRAEKRGPGRNETTGRTDKHAAEKRTSAPDQTAGRKTEDATDAGRDGLSASEAVSRARGALVELLGLPVEGVLGIDRDGDNWVATVQVLELARIPNTTDVLGEYETVLDGHGEVIRYHRTRRFHRGQVEGSQP